MAPRVLVCALVVVGAPLPATAAGPAPPGAPSPTARPRVAVRELQSDGEPASASPALLLQLQDGFGVGLTRAGIQVLDSVDVGRALQAHPELERCDTALCVKRLGEVLDVHYLIQPRVTVSGNSYRMTARLFRTEGNGAAVLPVDTQSRFCDVCTAAEAREVMIRLADSLRRPLEDPVVAAGTAPPAPPHASAIPFVALGAGLVAVAAGAGILVAAERGTKAVPALGGALLGAGLTVTGFAVYLIVDSRRQRPPVLGVALARTF